MLFKNKRLFFYVSRRQTKINKKKIYNQHTILKKFIDEKFNFYRLLQKVFDKIIFLVYFNRNRILYIDINVSKRRDFKIMIYHFKINIDSEKSLAIDIESIFCLTRLLNIVEFKY